MMKAIKFLWLISLVFLAGCQKADTPPSQNAPAKKEQRKVDYWTCSMHPQIHADKPGTCPICGMNLVPVYAASPASSIAAPGDSKAIALTEEGIRQAGVAVDKVEKRKLTKDLLIFGTLGYDLNLHRDVVPLVSGRIQKQFIDFNTTEVRKGEPLVSLYSTEALGLQEEYLKALRDRWLSTFYERELMSSMVKLAEEKLFRIGFSREQIAKLEDEKHPTGDVIVRAPVSGSVVGNMVHIGELAKTDMPLYHIVPLGELWFNAQVFEPDIGLLKLGEKIRITTKSHPGETFTGKLVFVGRAIDAANRTVAVRFVVPNKGGKLLPNLSASGSLEIPIGSVLSVPNTAVLDLGTRHVVYVQKEKGFYTQKQVRVGQVTQHFTQILEGVSEGDEVVTSGAFLIDAQRQLRAGYGDDPIVAPDGEIIAPTPMPAGHQH
jgi:membrane fusion protein, copper/silver efflux system